MRAGELRALKWENVDLRRGLIWIPDSKSEEPREIPLHPVLRGELARLRRNRPKRNAGHVFTKSSGRPYKDWRSAWGNATKALKLKGLRFHDLRHTFGTWQTLAGTHPFVAQALMGHRTQLMTRRYGHATDGSKRAAVEKLPSVGAPGKISEFAPTETPTRRARGGEHGEE